MATVMELCRTMAAVSGRQEADLRHRARRLREARLLPQKGRGLAAAHVGPGHCAALLIARLAPAPALHCVAAVRRIGGLTGGPVEVEDGVERIPRRYLARDLDEGIGFLDSIAAMIERLADADAVAGPRDVNIGVMTVGRESSGWIEIGAYAGAATYSQTFGDPPGDLNRFLVNTQSGTPTLARLAALLATT